MKKKLLFFHIILGVGLINMDSCLHAVLPPPPPPPPIIPIAPPPMKITPVVATKPITTVTPASSTTSSGKTRTVPFNLNPLIIHNLSSQEAILTQASCLIDSKPQAITIKNTKISPNAKNSISLKINIAENSSPVFTGYTSITINNDVLSVIHPDTKANYYGGSTIHINNIKGTWQVVPAPKNKPKDKIKNTGNKNNIKKISATKLVGTAATNSSKNPNKSTSSKIATQSTAITPPAPVGSKK